MHEVRRAPPRCGLSALPRCEPGQTGATVGSVSATKVYVWGGEHHRPQYTGGWVSVTWAAAVSSLDELRSLCAEQRVKYPSKPFQSKPGRAEWDAATVTERPGLLVFRNEEPTGDQTGDWQVLTNDG